MKATTPDDGRALRNTAAGFWTDDLVDDHLAAAAGRTPEAVAVVDRGRHWTYRELDDTVNRLARALRGRGVGPGDVVSWLLPNRAEAIVVHLAAIRLGAVSNPIIPIYRHRETAFILRQAASAVVVVPRLFRGFDYPAMVDDIRAEVPALQTVVVVDAGPDEGRLRFEDLLDEGLLHEGLLHEGADGAVDAPRTAADIALLLYTSGTTSAPKGVLHSHQTLEHENRSMIDFFGLSSADVVFMPSPVGHIIGVLYGMQLPFMLGSTVVLLDVWEPVRALDLIEEHRCSFVVAATPFLHGLVHHPSLPGRDVGSLRVFACGGADVPPELVRAATIALGCTVSRGYGSTEHPTATSSNASDPVEKRAGTDGRTIGAAEVRLSADGELEVRGPELFLGYLDDALNADAFTADGWFRTGDLARIDADGYVQIVGRTKDIIIRGGENISAREIEDQLVEHPAVADVAVVSSPDPVLGERVCAVVVPAAGATVTLPAIVAWLTERRTARQKLPERLILLDELPRNPSGKVQKFRLRDLARASLTPTEVTR